MKEFIFSRIGGLHVISTFLRLRIQQRNEYKAEIYTYIFNDNFFLTNSERGDVGIVSRIISIKIIIEFCFSSF